MSTQDRFDKAMAAMADTNDASPYEYDIDAKADQMRLASGGAQDTYSWSELPEHVRDYWREQADQ